MRFSTTELSQLESRITNAASEALAIETRIFADIAAQALEKSAELDSTAKALAALDVLAALAEIAVEAGWSRPRVDNSLAFQIEAGRHPVVEAALRDRGEPFVPKRLRPRRELGGKSADSGGKLAVVTGPNMAGKSTFLRQNALIAILAQIGSFVPAKSAHIGVVDRLFSRVGASDDLARGPVDLHGRNGRNRRDPQPGDRKIAGHSRRNRTWHGDLRWPVHRLGGHGAFA